MHAELRDAREFLEAGGAVAPISPIGHRTGRADAALALGVNTVSGHVTRPIVAEALDHTATPLDEALAA